MTDKMTDTHKRNSVRRSFDPVKVECGDAAAKRRIWSTVAVERAKNGIESGRRLVANPFLDNNTSLLKANLSFDRTDDEKEEFRKCADDVLFFAQYCKLMTPEGIKHVELRDYQKKYLQHVSNNRLSIYLACRQCGKTTISAIYMLWYVLFNIDKNALVVGSKRKVAVEILDKVKKIFVELPYFLRPGVWKWNEGEIVLDNGCRILAEATTINSGISYTFHCVLADEFAHVPPNILDKFYNNLFPTITAGKARFMITSTQNGRNLFYKLYKAAESGMNDYAAFKTDWYEVPEWDPESRVWVKRDGAWKDRQVANYGSEEAFNAQFGTDFDLGAKTLVSNEYLRNAVDGVWRNGVDMPGCAGVDAWWWKDGYDVYSLKTSSCLITVDLSEQIGRDYTTFIIWLREGEKMVGCACFHSNTIDREVGWTSLGVLLNKYCTAGYLLSFERNTYGDTFLRYMTSDNDSFVPISRVDVVSHINNDAGYGVKLTPGNKTRMCIMMKDCIESGKMVFDFKDFNNELRNFCDDGTGHYKASFGHDDIVMTVVQAASIRMSEYWGRLGNVEDTFWDPYAMPSKQNRGLW